MCVLQSRNQIPTSPSTVAALRLEHPTPVPRRRALGARGGIPGDADALSRERGTAPALCAASLWHLPASPSGGSEGRGG